MLSQCVKRNSALNKKAETTFVAIQETPQRFDKQKDLTRKETTPTGSTERWWESINSPFTACFKRVD